jgi:hypothetical protein
MAEIGKEGKLQILCELHNVAADKVNPFHNSRYASLAAIFDYLNPLMEERGLAICQSIALSEGDYEEETIYKSSETQTSRKVVTHGKSQSCITELIDVESGEVLERNSVPLGFTGADPQKIASAITYARRYGISALLGIATEEDDDANAASEPPAPKPKPRVNSNLPATPRQKQAIKKMLYKAGVWENVDDEGVEGELTRAENLKRTAELFGGLGIDVEVAAGVNPLEGLDVAQASKIIEELGKRIEGKENN